MTSTTTPRGRERSCKPWRGRPANARAGKTRTKMTICRRSNDPGRRRPGPRFRRVLPGARDGVRGYHRSGAGIPVADHEIPTRQLPEDGPGDSVIRRPTREEIQAAQGRTLPDVIGPGLRV